MSPTWRNLVRKSSSWVFGLGVAACVLSPAAAARSGMTSSSCWPPQSTAGVVFDERLEASERAASLAALEAALKLAQPWIRDTNQIRDRAKRDAAVEAIRTALKGKDPALRYAALLAFQYTSQATYDRKSFRDSILPLCTAETGDAQMQAFFALVEAERRPGDEVLLLTALKVPTYSVRTCGLQLLAHYFDRRIEGEAAACAGRILDATPDETLRDVLNWTAGATYEPQLEARLLARAAAAGLRSEAIQFWIRGISNKSRAVVEFLCASLAGSDIEARLAALHCLERGVAEADQALVADALLAAFDDADNFSRSDFLKLVGRYGSGAHVPQLKELATNDLLPVELQQAAERAVQAIGAR
jgi:hypothetical protein